MDRDTVVRLAKEAEMPSIEIDSDVPVTYPTWDSLFRFATLIANETLERAAKVCESRVDPEWPSDDASLQCEGCADAIRALKE